MFRTIMVPLDRSPLAEQALPLAQDLAWRAGATLDLVGAHGLYSLADSAAGRLPYSAAEDAEFRRLEHLYLEEAANHLTASRLVPIRTAVLDGFVVDALLDRQRATSADLIVMTTHGRGPVSRALLGSVADELIRRTPVPVLLLRPRSESAPHQPEPVLNHVLIALDGSPLAEQVLPPAFELARLWEARCTLIRVFQSSQPPSVHTSCRPCAPEEAEAMAYLEAIARQARAEGLRVDARIVTSRHVAETLLAQAHELPGNVIALATHGRGGLHRMLVGRVADQVIRGSAAAVLIFRPRS
jgi:nucleotide-binding universal stress UspA family protein